MSEIATSIAHYKITVFLNLQYFFKISLILCMALNIYLYVFVRQLTVHIQAMFLTTCPTWELNQLTLPIRCVFLP